MRVTAQENRRVTVTLSMSAVYLKLMTVLCVSCTALSGPESSGVERRDFGGNVTIQCRPPVTGQETLSLMKGGVDGEEELVLFKNDNSEKHKTAEEFSDRLELHGVFPNMDIVIKNLISLDTGLYWCIYTKWDPKSNQEKTVKGTGSVLLVVTDTTHRCDQSNNYLILVFVVICAAALCIVTFFLIRLILKAKRSTAKKPQRVANNDVYEDMRGTIRR